jgi:asparagine synthase (glutamine-hydrolysing)
MCGICGFTGFQDKSLITRMCSALAHRGPDDQGYYCGDRATLGHRRLSIIDLNSGKQPIHNEEEDIWVVCNGEIYNYQKLTLELKKKGHRFYTRSDTEVIVHCYEEFGDVFIEHLEGMFAIALWDQKMQKLVLGRDRLGKKPLYYLQRGEILIFASEIKAILEYDDIHPLLNNEILKHFLSYRSTPRETTFFQHIMKIPPGNVMIQQGNDIKKWEYWTLSSQSAWHLSDEDYISRFRTLFESAVQKRLMSDVPLGIYLSGGIDSSSITAIASKLSEQPINTFSIGFGVRTDEFSYARLVSDQFQTNHREIRVNEEKILSLLPKILWHLDEPIADPAIVPIYIMSGLTKKKVSVVLMGEGADELFAGYPKYKLFSPLFRCIPQKIRSAIYQYSPPSNVFNEKEQNALLLGNPMSQISPVNKEKTIFQGGLNQQLIRDLTFWLPEYLLMKVDKMTMAHGLEARIPFLDHHLVEFSSHLPANWKLRGLTGKYILRRSFADTLPCQIIRRPKKGFPMPLNSWISGEMRDTVVEKITESVIVNRLFDRLKVQKILNGYQNSFNPVSQFRYTNQAWELLIFTLWYEVFFEGSGEGL